MCLQSVLKVLLPKKREEDKLASNWSGSSDPLHLRRMDRRINQVCHESMLQDKRMHDPIINKKRVMSRQVSRLARDYSRNKIHASWRTVRIKLTGRESVKSALPFISSYVKPEKARVNIAGISKYEVGDLCSRLRVNKHGGAVKFADLRRRGCNEANIKIEVHFLPVLTSTGISEDEARSTKRLNHLD